MQPVVAAAAIRSLRQLNCFSSDFVDDLIQETYVQILKKKALAKFRADEPKAIYGFVQKIADSVAIDYVKAKNTWKRGGRVRHVPLDAVPSHDVPRRSEIERRVLIREIEQILMHVAPAPRDRAIFWFYYRQGMTAKEIALLPLIGLSEKGVESVLRRLTHEVRRRLGSSEDDPR